MIKEYLPIPNIIPFKPILRTSNPLSEGPKKEQKIVITKTTFYCRLCILTNGKAQAESHIADGINAAVDRRVSKRSSIVSLKPIRIISCFYVRVWKQ